MSETNNNSFDEVVEDFWARAWVMSMGTRTPNKEVYIRFRNFVEAELDEQGAWPPRQWAVLQSSTDDELREFLIQFVEYLNDY